MESIPEENRYALRGVSSGKEEVHQAIQNLDQGLFPDAFCRILPDLAGDNNYVSVMHADGAGTKSSLAYIYWKETGDLSVWEGIAQDAIVMNTDDLLCAGIYSDILLVSTIGRSKHKIPGEIISTLIQGTEKFLEELRIYGCSIYSAGGETADVGDLVRTIIVDASVYARAEKSKIIRNKTVQAGDVIVGLASDGLTNWDSSWNSGIGSNGLTSARHDLLHSEYLIKYPESLDGSTPKNLVYQGPWKVTDTPAEIPVNVGKAILSPTRTFIPLLLPILKNYQDKIHGMIHTTGGGHTKCLHYLPAGIKIIKNNFPALPWIFQQIHEHSGISWKQMYSTFNMGIRMEIYTDLNTAELIIKEASKMNLGAYIIGHCESESDHALEIHHTAETKIYYP